MKYIQKIANILGTALMIGSTAALAAAASYPTPFVQNGAANVAVVYGASSATSDAVAAAQVQTDLATDLAAQTATSTTTTSNTEVSGGDSVRLAKSPTNLFNLNEQLDDFYPSLDEDELSKVLAAGKYMNDNNDEFEYTQKLELSAIALTHFQNNDFNDDKPVVGFEVTDGTHILNYTLDFTPDGAEYGTALADLETTDLTLLGRTYYIVDASASASNGIKLTLLDAANTAIVTEGEASTISVNGTDYTVEVTFIDSTDVILKVNGMTTNKLGEGDVFKVGGDLYVAVKNNLYAAKDNGVSKVEISLGSGKIVLENGQEVDVNGDDVSDISDYVVTGYITNTSTEIDKIVLSLTADEDLFLAPGSDIVLPAFETIKLSMTGFTMPKSEETEVKGKSDDYIVVSTTVSDGKVELPILYSSGNVFTGIGKDSDELLKTSSNRTVSFDTDTDSYFVATWVSGDDSESYVLEVTEVSDNDGAKNTTTIKSIASSKQISLDIGEADEIGELSFNLDRADNSGDNATITVSAAGGSGSVYLDRLVTDAGLTIQLPVSNATGSANLGTINLTSSPTTWRMNFTEENEDENVASGDLFYFTLGFNSDNETQVSSVTLDNSLYETSDNSDKFVGYQYSALATKVVNDRTGDQESAVIYYAGSESFADVFVSELSAEFTSGSGSSSGATELGSVLVKDTEVASVSSKNLIVIGGSCVNSVAAELLGSAACESQFTTASGVKSGEALIKSFNRNGKTALLVAGYNADDTTRAVTYLVNHAVDTTAGSALKVTSATEATAITA